ncbi:L,D-transpeptidase family protein [Rhodobacteraceae bacterium]|nr:L,D-transpeptidase family protein [Paracoccaceae bacterium]
MPAVAQADISIQPFDRAVAEGAAQNRDLAQFYRDRAYRPLWTGPQDAARRAAFFRALDTASAQGLPAARYQVDDLIGQLSDVQSERQRGLVEARLSKVFLQYAQDVSRGVLTPRRVDAGIVRDIERIADKDLLSGFSTTGSPDGWLRDLAPKSPEYASLMRSKLDLEAQIARGGWGPVVNASILRPGETGAGVVNLRNRLEKMGYLPRSVTGVYDDAITDAVRRYQADQGLSTDGVAGPSTLNALNTAPQERLKSILVALERLRWMNGTDIGARHIWVNIPDFSVQLVDHGTTVFNSVTVVGKAAEGRETPEFSDQMDRMVINPTWHVPRSITTKEYLPQLQRNPYAVPQLDVVDGQGRVVPRQMIDFNQFTAQTFPFRLKEPPSTHNALGLVKFLFPNKYNIYLHDTPSKSLFSRDMRAFSHGCVRVGKPFDFAYALLGAQSANPQSEFHAILSRGQEKTVMLQDPVPVHLVYFTAWPAQNGAVEYRDDVYGRDAKLYGALRTAGVESGALSN